MHCSPHAPCVARRLGKTAQLLLALQWLATHRGVEGPFLVVAPVSTLTHWEREVAAWTSLSAVVLQGPADARRALLTHETRHTDAAGRGTGRCRFHVLITSPDGGCTARALPAPTTELY